MNSERWNRVQALFEQALELDSYERGAFLKHACGEDLELYQEVLSLLEADIKPHSLLDGLAIEAIDLPKELAIEGKRVGPYRIVHQIGSGGMGAVFLAERVEGEFEQRVAIKLIKRGMGFEDILKRFRSERQILAGLQHPNIARLLDGGLTEDGLPYFTMEYVEGEPITEYCDKHKLTVELRLKLFQTVCSAVQYAHRNLVVHRDLKPSNILVAEDGTVKLLDFGIAKMLAPESGEGHPQFPTLTRTGARVLTPEYASPEQLRGDSVTTAADIYSLGVVLYELLTGQRPYQLTTRSPADVERAVLTTEPKKPSTVVTQKRVSTETTDHVPTSEEICAARSTLPERLRKRLRGDLDNICLMALRKEPERRYSSVEQFLEDIKHHLQGLPVKARSATLAYRAQKFVKRHRTGVLMAAAVFLLTSGLVGFYTVQLKQERDRARLEAEKAEQVSEFLTSLFEVSDPGQSKGEIITARELLKEGAARVEKELAQQPEIQATMLQVMGNVYMSLGLYDSAASLLNKSLNVRKQLFGPEHLEVAKSLNSLGEFMRATGNYAASDSLLRRALHIQRKFLDKSHPDVAATLNNLAWLLNDVGDYTAAEEMYRQAIDIWHEHFGDDHVPAAIAMNNLALLYHEKGEYEKAERLFRKALTTQRRLLGDVHPEVATTTYNLAQLLRDRGNHRQAEAMYREVLALDRKLFGDEHPTVAYSLTSLGQVQQSQGDYNEAEALLREALAIREKTLGHENLQVLYSLNNLGTVLYDKGDFEAAAKLHREALQIGERLFGGEHPEVVRSQYHLARVLHARGDHDRAEVLYRQALAMREKLLGEDHPYVAHCLGALGRLLRDRKQYGTADSLFRKALTIYRKKYDRDHRSVAACLRDLASVLQAKGNFDEAGPLYHEALKIVRNKFPADHPEVATALIGLGHLFVDKGETKRAEALLQQGWEIRQKSLPKDHWTTAEAEGLLGACLTTQGRFQEAESHLTASYAALKSKRGESAPPTLESLARLIALYEAWGNPEKAADYRNLLINISGW